MIERLKTKGMFFPLHNMTQQKHRSSCDHLAKPLQFDVLSVLSIFHLLSFTESPRNTRGGCAVLDELIHYLDFPSDLSRNRRISSKSGLSFFRCQRICTISHFQPLARIHVNICRRCNIRCGCVKSLL